MSPSTRPSRRRAGRQRVARVSDHRACLFLRSEADGKEELIPRVLVAAIERDGRVEVFDGGRAVQTAWTRYATAQFVPRMDEAFRDFAKLRLVDECRRLIGEARARGVDEAPLEDWVVRAGRVRPTSEQRAGAGQRRLDGLRVRGARRVLPEFGAR